MNNNKITAGGYVLPESQRQPNTVILRQPKRFNIDISDFTLAMRAAEHIDFPRRYRLFDLYTDILTDTHLSSVIAKRHDAVREKNITFLRADGTVDDAVAEQIQSPWFSRLIDDILDSKFNGFSLFQFWRDGDWLNYDLIPRKNVDPVRRLILHEQTDTTGVSWDEFPNLLFCGAPRDLGLLYKAAPWIIYKRNDIADWAQFAEIFGMPTREYTYDSDDDDARNRAIRDSDASGSLSSFIHSKDTTFNLVDSGSKTASADLYERLADKCDKEISKLVLGNTLTTDASDKGTQALGTVHKKEEDKVVKSDCRYILNVLNYDMTDIFSALGVHVSGGRFSYPEPKDIDLTAKANILQQLQANFHLPVSDDYLYDTFGIEKPDNYDELKQRQEDERLISLMSQIHSVDEDDDDDDDGDNDNKKGDGNKPKNHSASFFDRFRSFFSHAPHDGALEW